MASYDSYQALRTSKINSIELLQWHFKSILESVHRRLVTKETFKTPWQIIIKVNVHQKTFIEFYKAIRDYFTDFGKRTAAIQDKRGKFKSYEVTFEKLPVFIRHMSLLFEGGDEVDVKDYLKRAWDSGSIAKVVCNSEKPIIVTYNKAKSEMTLFMSYEVTNGYCVKCSY